MHYLGITTLLAALVYRFFEHPMTQLREHFAPGK
jgi:peptidoglycan/LPS O-acetylase OafA/YrhL